MKKNVLKALFVGMVLSASLGVEAQPVSMADIPNMQAISGNRNTSLKEKVQALLSKMNERPELDWTGMCGLINSAVSSGYIGQKRAAVDALLPQIEHIIRTAAAAPQPAAPAPAAAAAAPAAAVPQVQMPDPAAAAAEAALEEQERARREAEERARREAEAEVNDLAGSILDRIEGVPGEKKIWENALGNFLSISDVNRRIEALTYLKTELEGFIAAQAARRLMHAAAQVRQEQQRLLRAVAAAAANSDSFDIFDSVYQVPNIPPYIPLEEYQQRQQEVAQAARRLMHAAAQVRQNDNASFKP